MSIQVKEPWVIMEDTNAEKTYSSMALFQAYEIQQIGGRIPPALFFFFCLEEYNNHSKAKLHTTFTEKESARFWFLWHRSIALGTRGRLR